MDNQPLKPLLMTATVSAVIGGFLVAIFVATWQRLPVTVSDGFALAEYKTAFLVGLLGFGCVAVFFLSSVVGILKILTKSD